MDIFLSVLLASLALLAITLEKTYWHLPLKELRRRARAGDKAAELLFKTATYGSTAQLFFWLIIGLSTAGFIVVLSRQYPVWLAFFGGVSLLWFGFAWLPRAKVGSVSLWLAKICTVPISKFLSWAHPLLNKLVDYGRRFIPAGLPGGLYEKEDLIDLLEHQKVVAHNRIDRTELDVSLRALSFGDKLVRDHMTPRRKAKFVKQDDSIGPILLTELHKSGFSRFPVAGDTPNEVVGTLYIRDLVDARAGGLVKNQMDTKVYFINEQQNLWQALNGFLKTRHHLFVVVNNFEEVVGVLSLEDVLEQILGQEIVDEFDQYENLRAVAQIEATNDHKKAERTEEVVE